MPDQPSLPRTPAELNEMLLRHLSSLRAAGVEWLPNPPPSSEVPIFSQPAQETPTSPAPIPVDGLAQRRVELQTLANRVAACSRCAELASSRTQTVFGVGRLDPDLCLIGEAPGADEDAQGEPFVGAAGQLLTRILAACGLRREEVYICNTLKCRPPRNRTPQVEEAENCSEYLLQQLELVRPRFICCLGSTAVKFLLNTSRSLGQMRQKVHKYHDIPVICTYHPAYLLPHRADNPQVLQERKRLVWDDMKYLMGLMGRPIPETKKSGA